MNFVDDSTTIVYTKDMKNLGEYINKFYILPEAVYNINKLAINSDKTELMIRAYNYTYSKLVRMLIKHLNFCTCK